MICLRMRQKHEYVRNANATRFLNANEIHCNTKQIMQKFNGHPNYGISRLPQDSTTQGSVVGENNLLILPIQNNVASSTMHHTC